MPPNAQHSPQTCDPKQMSSPLEYAKYLLSAHTIHQLPSDDGSEVAFAGRSNAGKSSVLNTLTRQNALARVSKTPGRTQQLVYFTVTPQRYLVDLPATATPKSPKNCKYTGKHLLTATSINAKPSVDWWW